MTDKGFRGDLRRVFDDMSGPPSAALRDRVRSSVAQAPEARRTYWLAAVAATVIAALLIGVLVAGSSLSRRVTPVGPGPAPSASAATSPTTTPSASPTAAPTSTLPAFVCTASDMTVFTTSSPVPVAFISDLRTGAHSGYDRLTITFGNSVPPGGIEIKLQAGTTFVASPSGQQLNLKGSSGILVVMHGADLHTSYSGPIDIVTGYAGLAEVRRVEDFEGTVQLGLGINVAPCYRAFGLSNPDRLVIDIQTA